MSNIAMPNATAPKIIFYDVDGVLNTYRTPDEDKANGMGRVLSEEHVRLLHALKLATGAHLVCVSSWRKYEANISVLKDAGLWEGLSTDYDNPGLPTRGHEVADWLNRIEHKPTRYVILDDKPEAYSDFRLLHTNARSTGIIPERGLNGEAVLWAKNYLNAAAHEPVIDHASIEKAHGIFLEGV